MFYTDRLMLRTIEPDADLNQWTAWLNDAEYLAAISLSPPVPTTKANAKAMLDGQLSRDKSFPCLVICEKPLDGKEPAALGKHESYFTDPSGHARYPFIGLLNIKMGDTYGPATRVVNFGIAFDREHQDRGYGTEVLKWANEYAFKTLGMHKVELSVDAANKRAIHVYEKVGFVREGVRRKSLWLRGQYCDRIEMGLLEEEWFAHT